MNQNYLADAIRRGATMSMSGRAFLRRCVDCRRLIFANAVAWGGDFAGDRGGEATYAVICTDCAKARRK
jgi:hypothetical protein